MNDTVIRLRQAVVCADQRTILDAVDVAIAKGERVAIVGRNGAGKSTMLKLMTGIVTASHGEIEVLGRELHGRLAARELRRLRAEIGQVFQGLHLVQRITVLENVLLGSLARHRSWLSWVRIFPQSEVHRAEQALQAVGLIGKAQLRADRLSGGERQKAAIARMLMQSPTIILADEPTASLDPLAAVDIANLLSSVARSQGSTLVSVVHDPGLLPLLADRVIGLHRGAILFDLPLGQIDDAMLGRLYRDDNRPDNWISRFQHASLPLGESV